VYDSVGRLVKDSVDGAVFHVFTYDANGNRLSYTSGAGTVSYSYDNQDRLLWARVGTDTTKYTYGSNGELKTKVAPGADTTTYSYDALGNLTSVVLSDETEIEYVIDGRNRRVGRKVNGVLVRSWLYQNQLSPIAELDSAGTVVSRFVYGRRVNVPDYMIRGDTVYRLITDHLGSVRLVVDTASGAIAQQLDYDESGTITQNTNPGFQPFSFAGGLNEFATGLTRLGFRDYDALIGRWTTRDPAGFASDQSNLYSYVGSDPVNHTDPTGLGIVDDLLNYFRCPSGKSCFGAIRDFVIDRALGGIFDLWKGIRAIRWGGDLQRIAERKLLEMQWRAAHGEWQLAEGLARGAQGYLGGAKVQTTLGTLSAAGDVGLGVNAALGGEPWIVTVAKLLPGLDTIIGVIDAARSCFPSFQRLLSEL
jgi:RHS repeat-associated protein